MFKSSPLLSYSRATLPSLIEMDVSPDGGEIVIESPGTRGYTTHLVLGQGMALTIYTEISSDYP
jgi:hypothetical protein